MKTLRILGTILIVLGIVMITTDGFQFQEKEKLIDTGKIDITIKKEKTVVLPWIAGGLAILGGIVLFLMSGNRREGPGES